MQAAFALSGEVLERLRQETESCGRRMPVLVEAARQTTLILAPFGKLRPEPKTLVCPALFAIWGVSSRFRRNDGGGWE